MALPLATPTASLNALPMPAAAIVDAPPSAAQHNICAYDRLRVDDSGCWEDAGSCNPDGQLWIRTNNALDEETAAEHIRVEPAFPGMMVDVSAAWERGVHCARTGGGGASSSEAAAVLCWSCRASFTSTFLSTLHLTRSIISPMIS